MKNKILLVFLILLFGLVFSSFFIQYLNNNNNLYEPYVNATKVGDNIIIYYDKLGRTAQIYGDKIVIIDLDGIKTDYIYDVNKQYYIAPNGAYVIITTGENGNKVIKLVDVNNNVYYFSVKTNNVINNNYDNYNHFYKNNNPVIFYGPKGEVAKVINTGYESTIVITYNNGKTDIYYIDKNNIDVNANVYYGPNGASAKIISTDDGRQAVEITGPNGNKIIYYDNNKYLNQPIDNTIYDIEPGLNDINNIGENKYYNSLPKGIPRNQIPPGDEDLYILKSQVVPPVCPRCPDINYTNNNNTNNQSNIKCPPCPPCARCPEPNFTCQKVPNYSNIAEQNNLPIPVLNDFSSFGM